MGRMVRIIFSCLEQMVLQQLIQTRNAFFTGVIFTDNFSIRSSLNSHDNIHFLNNALLPRKLVETTFLCVMRLYLANLRLAVFVCSGKLETKKSLM